MKVTPYLGPWPGIDVETDIDTLFDIMADEGFEGTNQQLADEAYRRTGSDHWTDARVCRVKRIWRNRPDYNGVVPALSRKGRGPHLQYLIGVDANGIPLGYNHLENKRAFLGNLRQMSSLSKNLVNVAERTFDTFPEHRTEMLPLAGMAAAFEEMTALRVPKLIRSVDEEIAALESGDELT